MQQGPGSLRSYEELKMENDQFSISPKGVPPPAFTTTLITGFITKNRRYYERYKHRFYGYTQMINRKIIGLQLTLNISYLLSLKPVVFQRRVRFSSASMARIRRRLKVAVRRMTANILSKE